MRRTTRPRAFVAATVMMGVLLLGTGTTPAAAAAPVAGTGTVPFGTVEDSSYYWRAYVSLEGTFVLGGQTYGFMGQLDAWNNCCTPLGSSGSGWWYFSGSLYSATGALGGWIGGAVSSSSPMTYTRSEIVPGTVWSLDMRLTGPATAYLPDGSSVGFNVAFFVGGTLTDNSGLDGACGSYPGCRYDATYTQHDTPSLVAVGATGSATSSGASVGWSDSSTNGGLLCASVTGNCSGGSVTNLCPTGACSRTGLLTAPSAD